MPNCPPIMTSVTIHNMTSREAAEPLVQLLEGKTFMNLEVGLAPVGGSFDVVVSTARPDTSEQELREMVTSVLVSCVLSMSSAPVLRALAVGCDRLNDGDQSDRRTVQAVDGQVLTHFGLVRRGTGHEPKQEAAEGYIEPLEGSEEGRYAWTNAAGEWIYSGDDGGGHVPAGSVLYADPDCTVVLRTV